ncbi:MAG: hypothetical protein J07HX5_01842 [halophilic archaeon J07HX5]|nr:MAG: hypothetical protein J07HX5_01842 [halophilic archaeon J07HX5]
MLNAYYRLEGYRPKSAGRYESLGSAAATTPTCPASPFPVLFWSGLAYTGVTAEAAQKVTGLGVGRQRQRTLASVLALSCLARLQRATLVPERPRSGVLALPTEDVAVEVVLVFPELVDNPGGVVRANAAGGECDDSLFSVALD